VYVANNDSNTVSVIETARNAVTATLGVGVFPFGIAVTPDGSRVYVANEGSNTLSVIETATMRRPSRWGGE
jgi:YVTN family beta-propeller protein